MASSTPTPGRVASSGPISPELALVDPELAERARLALPARPEYPPPLTFDRPRADVSPTVLEAGQVGHPRLRRRGGAAVALAAAAALGGLASALVTASVGEPAARPPAAALAPAAENERAADVAPLPVETPAAAPTQAARQRDFAWAPVAGAQSYEFQLFRGTTLVYRSRVLEPRLALPARWRLEGRQHVARPGSYRWYVWPVLAGKAQPAKKATVQATFVID